MLSQPEGVEQLGKGLPVWLVCSLCAVVSWPRPDPTLHLLGRSVQLLTTSSACMRDQAMLPKVALRLGWPRGLVLQIFLEGFDTIHLV